ncbi:PP2C family protein-serine/threonine phosphatase [Antribacter gilvus]|uniref:PP2C family protein-serine/threonine phosphatase n=1 Tax=Antribacter gilvus TaxID=2304675 RepID=UPI000F7B2F9B|nr:GAF domain-containing SpoIIE family protein phosphatase [Antribacter gilvus]
MGADWFLRATDGSESGASARAVDWSATPLGPPSTWPSTLRVAVELCFSTRFPVFVGWGPELTMIYNDGYRAMLGTEKHPGAMGAPASVVWAEIWAEISPLFDEVLSTGHPTWIEDMVLYMRRSGYREETAFTFSYSALKDEDGTVRGVLDIATETTGQVVDRRRLTTLGDLSAALQEVTDDLGVIGLRTIEVLGASRDVLRADLYVDTQAGLSLLATSHRGRPDVFAPPEDLVAALAGGEPLVVADDVVLAPLVAASGRKHGVLVLAASPLRPFDDAYRSYLLLLASVVARAIEVTVEHLREVDQLRTVSDTLQLAMTPEAPPAGWYTAYRPADGNLAVGGDWYDVVRLDEGRRGIIVGDCSGHGLEAAARMGPLRSAARALLLEEHGPAATLAALDRFVGSLPGAEFATVFCGVLDERTGSMVYAVAGHPPGLVVGRRGTVWLDGARGAPLAVGKTPRRETLTRLRPGDTLVLYTDGMIERRGESLRVSLDRLEQTARELFSGPTSDTPAEDLVEALVPGRARDDVAVVVYRHRAGGYGDQT